MEHYFLHGLAESTRKTYNSAKRRYSEFAAKHGFQPLPASEHQLCQFVSYQAEGKLCHSTIKCYLSAVRQMHVAEGYGDPRMSSMAHLERVLKGIKSLQAGTRGRSLPRLPITPDLLLKMRGVAEKRDNTMLWAAVTLVLLRPQLTFRDESARRTVIRSHPCIPRLHFSREKGIMCGSWRVSMLTQSKLTMCNHSEHAQNNNSKQDCHFRRFRHFRCFSLPVCL